MNGAKRWSSLENVGAGASALEAASANSVYVKSSGEAGRIGSRPGQGWEMERDGWRSGYLLRKMNCFEIGWLCNSVMRLNIDPSHTVKNGCFVVCEPVLKRQKVRNMEVEKKKKRKREPSLGGFSHVPWTVQTAVQLHLQISRARLQGAAWVSA